MTAPVLIAGLDAGVPELVARWVADGSLPFIAGLSNRAGSAALEGDELMMEDGFWLSLFSGRPRGELHRHSYRLQRDGGYELALADPAEPPHRPLFWGGPGLGGTEGRAAGCAGVFRYRRTPAVGEQGAVARGVRGRHRAVADAMGEDTRVVVVAANGLDRRGPVDALMADFCRRLGYSPAPAGLRRPADVLARRAPRRLRALAARAIARSGVNRVATERFGSASDWSRTRAFAIPDPFVGMIRVNLAGREPAGIVEPGPEYEETIAALGEDLLALRDPRTGARAIERVARMRAAGGGPPERCPDLVATFKRHEPTLLAVEHPRATIRQAHPWLDARNGHSGRGMVVGLGGEPMPCLDLAPSILSLMGAPAKA